MKTCPKCGELNGEDRGDCYRCHAALPKNEHYRKICPKCGSLYNSRKERCDNCAAILAVYTPGSGVTAEPIASWWHYAVAILFPLFGIIMGLIYLSRGEDELGKTVITTTVVAVITEIVLGILLVACSAL
ncbi:MAG: hypothetical protein ACERKO_00885 [Acetanaerobacterium sp.]